MKNKLFIQLIAVLCVLVWAGQGFQCTAEEEPVFEMKPVSGNVYCLYGKGGNIGVLKTDDGLLLVDSQYSATATKALSAVAGLSDKPVKFLVNTHFHGDHTDGTPVLGKGATILMHPNCKASVKKSTAEKKTPAEYLDTVIDWTEGKTLTLGNETVRLLHFGNGHTAGDLVVVFETSKVLHMGDLFFNNIAPYIDVKDGSDTGNWLRTIETVCKQYPDFKIIPGHGPVTDTAGYMKLAGYLTLLRKHVGTAVKAGKSRQETIDSAVFTGYETLPEYGDFMTKKNNVGWIYDEMTRGK